MKEICRKYEERINSKGSLQKTPYDERELRKTSIQGDSKRILYNYDVYSYLLEKSLKTEIRHVKKKYRYSDNMTTKIHFSIVLHMFKSP